MTAKTAKTRAKRRKKVSRKERQRKLAENLAKGMSTEPAMIAAGYSPYYANSKGYQVVKRPYIQSIFTESCERILQANHLAFDSIVKPYFEALHAKVIVKSQQLGDAQEVNLPDHALRMTAADRIIELYGGTVEPSDTTPAIGELNINHVTFYLPENRREVVLNGHGNGSGAA